MESAESDVLIVRALGVQVQEDCHWGISWDIVTGNKGLTRSDEIVGGVRFCEGNGVDGALMAATNHPTFYTEQSLYGVFQMTTNQTWNSRRILNHKSPDAVLGDVIQIYRNGANQAGVNLMSALIYILPTNNLDAVATDYNMRIEVDDNASSGIRAAIRNDGTWYVSSQSFTSAGKETITSIAGHAWAEVQIADNTMTNVMPMPTNFVVRTDLTSIDAVGFFVGEDTGNQFRILEIRVASGTLESNYDKWTDSVGLYNANAPKTGDPDNDGVNNVWEWGQGGNPLDSGSVGHTERIMDSLSDGGTNYLVYIYPRLKDPRPTYTLTETDNLVYGTFVNAESNYVKNVFSNNWQGDTKFNTVTNLIPVTGAVKIIKLNIN
jgi:hypothetical protein